MRPTVTEALPPHTLYLPGRSVEIVDRPSSPTALTPGVVCDVYPGDPLLYRVLLGDGSDTHVTGDALRPVIPDRQTLAVDEMFCYQLGRWLAEREGRLIAHDAGYNNGTTSYKEVARDALRGLDVAAFHAKHSRCFYSYVVDPGGKRREGRTTFEDGDTLIVCPWYPDGPGGSFCAPHKAMEDAGERSSIFMPAPPGWTPECPDLKGITQYRTEAPLRVLDVAQVPAEEAAEQVRAMRVEVVVPDPADPALDGPATETVEQQYARIITGLVRDDAELAATDGATGWPGVSGRVLRVVFDAYLVERHQTTDGTAYYRALGLAVRSGGIVMRTGPYFLPGAWTEGGN